MTNPEGNGNLLSPEELQEQRLVREANILNADQETLENAYRVAMKTAASADEVEARMIESLRLSGYPDLIVSVEGFLMVKKADEVEPTNEDKVA